MDTVLALDVGGTKLAAGVVGADGRAWLMRCAEAREAWFGPGGWQPPMRGRVENLLGLPEGAGPAELAALCADGTSEIGNIRQIDRGYERIDERLRALGAAIERVEA